MKKNRFHAAFLMTVLAAAGFANLPGARTETTLTKANDEVVLKIVGEVPQARDLTADDFAKLPQTKLRATGREGKEEEYEGVLMSDLLQAAGMKLGQDLRGPAMANYLAVEARDGYKAVFALPELDSAWTDRVVLLARTRDGKTFDEREGPLRVVVSQEKRHGRWVRQVSTLRVGKS